MVRSGARTFAASFMRIPYLINNTGCRPVDRSPAPDAWLHVFFGVAFKVRRLLCCLSLISPRSVRRVFRYSARRQTFRLLS
jgi:hypothetical protein